MPNVVTEATGTPISASTLLGYREEAARSNLMLRSEEFDNAAWTKGNLNVSANAVASPDGASTADKIVYPDTTSTYHHLYQSFAGTAAVYTFSFYAKAAEYEWLIVRLDKDSSRNVTWFHLSGSGSVGTVGSYGTPTASIEALANGWYRIVFRATMEAVTEYAVIGPTTGDGVYEPHAGTANEGLYIWGAQVELLEDATTCASTYIPTTTVAVTRNADALTYPNTGNISDAAGTIFCEYTPPDTGHQRNVLGGSGGYFIARSDSSQAITYDGTAQATAGSGWTVGVTKKAATRWSGSVQSAFLDGVIGTSPAYDGTWLGASIGIGGDAMAGGATNNGFGTIRNVRIWLHALSDSQVKAIS